MSKTKCPDAYDKKGRLNCPFLNGAVCNVGRHEKRCTKCAKKKV